MTDHMIPIGEREFQVYVVEALTRIEANTTQLATKVDKLEKDQEETQTHVNRGLGAVLALSVIGLFASIGRIIFG